jgi:hypothetical protein
MPGVSRQEVSRSFGQHSRAPASAITSNPRGLSADCRTWIPCLKSSMRCRACCPGVQSKQETLLQHQHFRVRVFIFRLLFLHRKCWGPAPDAQLSQFEYCWQRQSPLTKCSPGRHQTTAVFAIQTKVPGTGLDRQGGNDKMQFSCQRVYSGHVCDLHVLRRSSEQQGAPVAEMGP